MAIILGRAGLQAARAGKGRQAIAIAGLALGLASIVIFVAVLLS